MKIAYYPGCSGKGTSAEYEASTQAVFHELGISSVELNDWNCCGSTPAHATDALLSGALCARNLNIAADTMKSCDVNRFATPCPSCLSNLKTARMHLSDAKFRESVDKLLDEPCPPLSDKGEEPLPEPISTLQMIVEDIGYEKIASKVKRPLKGLKIAPYYGCLLTRPKDIMKFDSPENPTSMDKLLEALGAEVVPFPMKTECCGAAMGIPKRAVTANLTAKLLSCAVRFGANMVAVACPLCHMNLDLRQRQVESVAESQYNIPVLYFTQLMGIAFGLDSKELGLDKLIVSPDALLGQIGKEGA